VTDQTSAETPQSSASSFWASSAHGTETPEASNWAFGPVAADSLTRCKPRRMPSTSTFSGSAGWICGSLYTVM